MLFIEPANRNFIAGLAREPLNLIDSREPAFATGKEVIAAVQ